MVMEHSPLSCLLANTGATIPPEPRTAAGFVSGIGLLWKQRRWGCDRLLRTLTVDVGLGITLCILVHSGHFGSVTSMNKP